MDYLKLYNCLMNKAENRNLNGVYYEKHHVIPKCIHKNDYVVKLTAKEHYVAHHLLVKMYKDTKYYSKMICAFRYMSVDSHNGNRIKLKDYEYMRNLYSKNHPMKNPEVIKKFKKSLREYFKNETKEQKEKRIDNLKKSLREYFKNETKEQKEKRYEKIRKSIEHRIKKEKEVYIEGESQHDIRVRMRSIISKEYFKNETKEQKEKRIDNLKKYFKNETKEQKEKRLATHKKCHTIESYRKTSKSLSNYIKKLSLEEKENRLNKSLRKCDHEKRGKSISKGKLGKKTNQQEIMGIKYSKMTDKQFNEFIKNKKDGIKIRMVKLRERYINA